MQRYCLVRKWRSRTCCSHLKISPTKKEMSKWSLFTTYFSLPSSVEVQTIGICEVSESHKTTIEMCLFTNCGRLLKQSCVTFYHYRLYCSHGFALITRCKTDKVIVFIGIKLNRNFRCLVEKKVLCPSLGNRLYVKQTISRSHRRHVEYTKLTETYYRCKTCLPISEFRIINHIS